MTKLHLLLFLLLSSGLRLPAQHTALVPLPGEYLTRVTQRVGTLEEMLEGKSEKLLRDFQRGEEKIYQKLLRKDSTKAAQFFASSKEQYQQLEQRLQSPGKLTQYLPSLDTLKTSLQFLGEHQELLTKTKDATGQLAGALGKVKALEGELAKAEVVKQFLRQRRAAELVQSIYIQQQQQ